MRAQRCHWFVIGAAGALVASCASAPRIEHPAPPVEPPPSWTAVTATTGATATGSPWWFDLARPPLRALIAEGLSHNHDLAAAAARVSMAVAQARIAGASTWPQVDGGANATRSRRNFVGFPDFGGGGGGGGVLSTTTNAVGASLSASWEVDLWGRLRTGAAAAVADLQASRFDLAGARLSLEAQIVRAYAAAAEARRQVDLSQATAANLDMASQRIERRYERGLRPALDVHLARSNAAVARATLAARRGQLDAGMRQLELLLGRYPAAELAVDEFPTMIAAVPAGLPAELIGRRPDLAAAERRLVAAGLRVSAARRALLPRISLTASGGRSSEELGDLLDGDFSVWNLVGNLTVPLFHGGRLRAQVDAAEAGRDAEAAAYASRVLIAFAEVEAALRTEELLVEQEAALTEAAEQAQAAERLAADRYGRGLVDLITLLDAQRRAYEAQSQLLSIRRQRVDARVDLHAALGGGFTPLTTGHETDG